MAEAITNSTEDSSKAVEQKLPVENLSRNMIEKQKTGICFRPRRPKCGPTTVEWKKHGYKRKTLGFIAASAGLIAAP